MSHVSPGTATYRKIFMKILWYPQMVLNVGATLVQRRYDVASTLPRRRSNVANLLFGCCENVVATLIVEGPVCF